MEINITAIIITFIICGTIIGSGLIAYKMFLVQLAMRREENKGSPWMRALLGFKVPAEKKAEEEQKNDE